MYIYIYYLSNASFALLNFSCFKYIEARYEKSLYKNNINYH